MGMWLVLKNIDNPIFQSWNYYKEMSDAKNACKCNFTKLLKLKFSLINIHEMRRFQKCFKRDTWELKSSPPMKLCSLKQVFNLSRYWCYKDYIYTLKKVKNMPNHILPHLAWNAWCKLQKIHNNVILSFAWVVDIKRYFKRWDVEDLLELLSDAMKHVVIEERLMEPLRKSGKMLKGQN